MITALFTATVFTSAVLVLLIQPVFARMTLPLLGGSPSVWNTAMVFYQFVLLIGYAYAHVCSRFLRLRHQTILHGLLLLLPFGLLPFTVPASWVPPTSGSPIPWLLALMSVSIGLPFFVVTTTSPLLQRWFSRSGHPQAHDPYFLYAASNVGSILALLSYPTLIEPSLSLAQQAAGWKLGYIVYFVLMLGCGTYLWRSKHCSKLAEPEVGLGSTTDREKKVSFGRKARWVLLAFIPSSLMLGVTTYLSTDIAVIPLIWVVTLVLYLLSFVLGFGVKKISILRPLQRIWAIILVALLFVFNTSAGYPIWLLFPLHLIAFFVAALICHAELAQDRPSVSHLTEFFFWLAVGGVLGGAFNALLAPLLFGTIVEYPLILLLVSLVPISTATTSAVPRLRPSDGVAVLIVGTLAGAIVWVMNSDPSRLATASGSLLLSLPLMVCYFLSRRPLRFALCTGVVLLACSFRMGEEGRVLRVQRSFFGVHRVTVDPAERYHMLVHGVTLHGMQSLDPARRNEALTYYYRTGPVGEVMEKYAVDPKARIGVVGLGAGSLACYAKPKQSWTYYEIDGAVVSLARDDRYFTFLRDSPADLSIVLGDARLSLAADPGRRFDILVLDAFSSDSVPIHLLTREALAIYLRRLGIHGVLAFHISNVYLDLEPVLSALTGDAGLVGLVCEDTNTSSAETEDGKSPSIWFVAARESADLELLAKNKRWQPPRRDDHLKVWTDSYSSLLRVFRWQTSR